MSIYDYHVLKGLDLSEERVINLLPTIQSRFFETGELVYEKGEKNPPWCHVVSGMVNGCTAGSHERSVSINIYGAGSWLGETSFITQQASTHRFVALTPSRLLCLPYATALKAFEEDFGFSRYLARLAAWRSQQHAEMLALMKTGSPPMRVIMGLAMFAESISNGTSHLPQTDTEDTLTIPVKQEVLASMCGVSRGIFSECIQHLAKAGWIELNYATMSLLYVKAWKRFSNSYRNNHWQPTKARSEELIKQMTVFLAQQVPKNDSSFGR